MAQLFRDIGWQETPASDANHQTFQCSNGVVLAPYGSKPYESEFGPPTSGFRGFTLAIDLASFGECRAADDALGNVDGVDLLEEPTGALWGGGFSWRDPEGNVWDVAWAKDAELDEQGGVTFP